MKINEEIYHIYNRGAHKEKIFRDKSDYERFCHLLYISNNDDAIKYTNLKQENIYNYERKKVLVDILAYCLMPNHYHLVLRQRVDNGISKFVHRLCTSYSMYFNVKYDHSGTIFQGPYNNKHVDNDDYLRYLIQYVHLNPYGIEEPELLRDVKREYINRAIKYSKDYKHSSYKDYLGIDRVEKAIVTVPADS